MWKKFAGRIYREAQRLIQLVEDTIKISQLDEGENPYEWENVDIYSVARNVCGNLKEIAQKKNVHLYIDGERLICRTVRPIFEEILYNLCDNGIKYNKDNGTVTIHLKDIAMPFRFLWRIMESESRERTETGCLRGSTGWIKVIPRRSEEPAWDFLL